MLSLRGGNEAARIHQVIVGSVAAVGPLAVRAQQPERMRRIGYLCLAAEDMRYFGPASGIPAER